MMRYLEAPQRIVVLGKDPALFLAGGITGCPNWQADVCRRLTMISVLVMNPRRARWDMAGGEEAATEQIQWENSFLRLAGAILFWFPKETLCPIVLYELGAWSMTQKRLFVGTHPEYARRLDVVTQTRLARPDVQVVHDLVTLCEQVKAWVSETR